LNFFSPFSIFEQLSLALKNRFNQKIFKQGAGSSPPATRLVRLWAYGVEDENTIFHIAWKIAISKWHEQALCPLNGLCLFGSKIRGYYCYKKGVYV